MDILKHNPDHILNNLQSLLYIQARVVAEGRWEFADHTHQVPKLLFR